VFSSRPAVCDARFARVAVAGGEPVVEETMGSRHIAPSIRQWAQVATATLLVAGCPVAIVWWLRASGTISSAVLCVVLGMGLSLGTSRLGCVLWEKRSGAEDLLFSELMIWGFLHRWHTQRRLASARDTLGPMTQTQRRVVNGLSTKAQAKLLERLVAGMETRDPYLNGHSRRVARHSWRIARRMGLPREEVARIRTAAAIHDVGKIETPRAILHKAGPLTEEEYEAIKRHPADGARMAAVLRDAELTSMVGDHHERLDGTGYPFGLAGEDIPLGARIIAVADTFDAVTSTRPYRPARSHGEAIDILRHDAGTRLDPAVVRAFCSHYAGRRPLALWSSVAGLPERVVSWLGGGVASVASAAKVVAVTAFVGGVAATTSTLAVPPAKPHPTKVRVASTASPQAQVVQSTLRGASARRSAAAAPTSRHVRRMRPVLESRSVHGGLPASQAAGSSVGGAVGAQPSSSRNAGAGPGQGTGPGKSEEATSKPKREGPLSKGEEATSKVKSEAVHGKREEAPSKAKSEEAVSKVKSGEAVSKAKSEEAVSKVKSEAAHPEVKEAVTAVHSKVEEVVGKAKEVVGKIK
jgi:hypothetical protein